MPEPLPKTPSKSVARMAGVYRLIPPESYQSFGVDQEDVPIGTFPAQDHPPFLPNRFGGNAYGLGFFEQSILPAGDALLLESVDLDDPAKVSKHYRDINDVFKRLGLLVRYSSRGEPFYLIPRQLLVRYLVELRAKVDRMASFLDRLMSHRLRENLSVGLIASDGELFLPELKSRQPQMSFIELDSLDAITQARGPLDAVLMVGDPRQFALAQLEGAGIKAPQDRNGREAFGFFMSGRIYDLLSPEGEVLCLCDRPLGSSREKVKVTFKDSMERKRFLIFSHLYHTRRRYRSKEGGTMEVNRFDFNAFLFGLGVWHESVEELLEGRKLEEIEFGEIDQLPYRDLSLPRGSAPQLMTAWKRWLGIYFDIGQLSSELPELQETQWAETLEIDGEFPETLLVMRGVRRRPPLSLDSIISQRDRNQLAGCPRHFLADYKNSFEYVVKVLEVLSQVKEGTYRELPGLELSRLRKPFESAVRTEQLSQVLDLMARARGLSRLESHFNPMGIMGQRTPVIENLEKLSLMGWEAGLLRQLYLIVAGHSTMSRVTFGKLPMTTLSRISDVGSYASLDEAVRVLRLYRLLSVAETSAASAGSLSREQVQELFSLYDNAIRVVTDPKVEWADILAANTVRLGGVQATAIRKMLKLFNLFDFLDSWQTLEVAGPRKKEALADYDPQRLRAIDEVIGLSQQVHHFVGRFYARDSFSRPYFFRGLLGSEIHGSGRVLPQVGTRAGFTLLWICIHISGRRLIDFNPLVKEAENQRQVAGHLEKLRQALLGLSQGRLSPGHLEKLGAELANRGEAYVYDSGLYFTENRRTGALEPHFVDVGNELDLLEAEQKQVFNTALDQMPGQMLEGMDRRAHEIGRFLAAQEAPPPEMAARYDAVMDRMRSHFTCELMVLESFSTNLRRMISHLPNLMDSLLPQPSGDAMTAKRLAAAVKLSAMHQHRLEGFQDMWLSHEAARNEFGPAAAGILGVSPLQFQTLTSSLGQILKNHPRLGFLLMAAILLYDQEGGLLDKKRHAALLECLDLNQKDLDDLAFLVDNHALLWQLASGEVCLLRLEPVLKRRDPPLGEALFLLAVISASARREGLMSEDLLDAFFNILQKTRDLGQRKASALEALQQETRAQATNLFALERYQELGGAQSPAISLQHLLRTTVLPELGRDYWLGRGHREMGLSRLLRLKGLFFINPLDLRLARHEVPLRYIYRQRRLRSMGETHFERDLFEGLRTFRALERLPVDSRHFIMDALARSVHPLEIKGFAPAAGLLTYENQIKLLLLGLAAAHHLSSSLSRISKLSFAPLAQVIGRKFEMVNQAVTALEPDELVSSARSLKPFMPSREGLRLELGQAGSQVSILFADPARFERKLLAVSKAKTPAKLKRIYHQELGRLKLTTHSTLDYQNIMERAFSARILELGLELVEQVKRDMEAETDMDALAECFERYWEQGLELPLDSERQQSLRDIFEMNLERLRGMFMEEVLERLAGLSSTKDIDRYWQKLKKTLRAERRHLGRDFELLLADAFDRRTAEVNAYQGQ